MSPHRSILVLMLTVGEAFFAGSVARAGVSAGERCSAFIQSSAPGVAVTVPFGAVYPSLGEARKDALKRCHQTNKAKEGWGKLCHAQCVPVDR